MFLLYFRKARAPHIERQQGVAFLMRSGSSCVTNKHFIIQNLLSLLQHSPLLFFLCKYSLCVPKYKSLQRFPLWITYRCIQIHFRVQIYSFCSICSAWWNLYKDLYLGMEGVLIKEERKRNMLRRASGFWIIKCSLRSAHT